MQQCKIIAKLAEVYLKNQDYSSAAKLLNGALVIVQDKIKADDTDLAVKTLETELLAQLKAIEPLFIKKHLQIEYKALDQNYGINFQHKAKLIKLRQIVKLRLLEFNILSDFPSKPLSSEIQGFMQWIAQEIISLLHQIVADCIQLMPSEPPCEYALVGLGSLARAEMTPYSDLEVLILIKDDSPKNKWYFKQLSQLFELKIINLGETDLVKGQDLLPVGMLSPVLKGFSLDIHKNPMETTHELIGTPAQIARYQLPECYVSEPGNHLSCSLLNCIFITGSSKQLLLDYEKEVNEIYKCLVPNTQETLRLVRTLALLKDDLNHFEPALGAEDEGRLIQVKDDLYRLPQTIIDALALYMNLCSGSTWDRIDQLCSQEFMEEISAEQLKKSMSIIVLLRLKTYDFYNSQQETLDTLLSIDKEDLGIKNQSLVYGLNDSSIAVLVEVYKNFILLHKSAVRFYQSSAKNQDFLKNMLFDRPGFVTGVVLTRLCQYKKALECFENELETLKDDKLLFRVYNRLAIICQSLGKLTKSLDYYNKALNLSLEVYGKNHRATAKIYNNLGNVNRELGLIEKGIELYKEAIRINMECCAKKPAKVAIIYSNLGEAYQALGKTENALQYHQDSLEINIEKYGKEHPNVARNHNNLGECLQSKGDFEGAIVSYEKALAIHLKYYGGNHFKIAVNYNNLGAAWQSLGTDECLNQAVHYFNQAIEIDTKVFGANSPDVAMGCTNLGDALRELEFFDEAIHYHMRALTINISIYSDRHYQVATCLNNLGVVYIACGDPQQAIGYLNDALSIDLEVYEAYPYHPSLIRDYNNLGAAYGALRNVDEAIKYLNLSIRATIEVHGSDFPDLAGAYNLLGLVYLNDGKLTAAYPNYIKSLRLLMNTFGLEHPNLPEVLDNLSHIYSQLEDNQEAEELFHVILQLFDGKPGYLENFVRVSKVVRAEF